MPENKLVKTEMSENKSIFNTELIAIEDNTTWHIITTVKLNTIDDTMTYESKVFTDFHREEKRKEIFVGTYRECYEYLHKKFS